MKKTAILLIMALILSCCAVFAAADSLTIKEISCETYEDGSELKQRITVSVEAPVTLANKNVGLYLVRPNATDSSPMNYLAAGYQSVFGSDGTAKITFDFDDVSGDYTFVVFADTVVNAVSQTKNIPSVSIIRDFLKAVNDNKTTPDKIAAYKSVMAEQIETNWADLTIDAKIFNQLDKTVRETICEEILKTTGTITIKNFFDIFKEKLIIYGTRDSDGAAIQKILEYDNYKSDVNLSSLDIYTAYSSIESKSTVFDLMAFGSPDTIDEIKTLFYESAFLTILREDISYQNILAKAQTYRASLIDSATGLEYSFITALENETEYQTEIMDYVGAKLLDIETVTELSDEIMNAINNKDTLFESNEGEGYTPPSPPGGGGGGGGGGAVKVEDDFVEKEPAAPVINTVKFDDLDSVKWAQEAILSLNSKGILLGDGTGKFNPTKNITRAEFIKIVVEAFGLGTYADNEIAFSDVNESDWHYAYIKRAVSNGITNGKSDDYFGASDSITREEMFTLIYRTLTKLNKIKPVETVTKQYSDYNTISEYAKNSILMLSEYKIANGFEDNTIRPKGNATRAESAQLIFNVLGFTEE